jgi:hypothetical protein
VDVTAGSDYASVATTVTVARGETTKRIVINVVGDRIVEPNETFMLALSSAYGATISDDGGVATILNDD